jgi:DNA-directed RNA polymerase subunit RPC12/RpoP
MKSGGREGEGMNDRPLPQIEPPAAFRVLVGIFGLVFGGVGICVLGLIWSSESDFVPLFAKLFGSLLACAFLAFGGFLAFTAFTAFAGGKNGMMSPLSEAIKARMKEGAAAVESSATAGSYVCASCGAALGEKADVSPMGDVKCTHCGRWFNVHKQG